MPLHQLAERGSSRRQLWTGVDDASSASSTLLAGLLVWGGAGWLLDRWLGTDPWLLVIGVLFGNAAGIYLMYVRSRSVETDALATGRVHASEPAQPLAKGAADER